MDAEALIKTLQLSPLPEEGGFYRETFRDPTNITSLEDREGARPYSTCIYYLITPEEFSGLHKVKSAEIFHFYLGDPVEMVQINESGQLTKIILGPDLLHSQQPQAVVPANTWQGTRLLGAGKWALLGCTVAPGFDFSDFSGATAATLSQKFPQHSRMIQEYTHN